MTEPEIQTDDMEPYTSQRAKDARDDVAKASAALAAASHYVEGLETILALGVPQHRVRSESGLGERDIARLLERQRPVSAWTGGRGEWSFEAMFDATQKLKAWIADSVSGGQEPRLFGGEEAV